MQRGAGFRADLQGMRAVAVTLVVLDHVGLRGFSGGYVGVDVFFVLSGFLITGLLLSEARETGSVSLKRFYMRRARRILPAALLTLVVTDIAAYYLTNFVRAKQAIDDSIWTAFFAANIHFAHQATNYFDSGQPPSPLLHYWSLAVEEQFYLVWPALLGATFLVARALKRRGPLAAGVVAGVITVLSLIWSVHDTRVDPQGAYFSPFVRAWELGLGALLVFVAPALSRLPQAARAAAGWAGLAAILYASVVFTPQTAFPGSAALVPTVGAALVILAGLGTADRFAAGRVLSLGPFRWLGDRSYALYLWHWPVLVLAAQYVGHPLSKEEDFMLVAATVLLAALSYGLFENPIRNRRWSGRTAVVLWPASVAASLVVAVVLLQFVDAKESSAAVTKPKTTVSRFADPAIASVRAAAAAAKRGAKIPSALTPSPAQLAGDYYQTNGCAASNGDTTTPTCFVGDTSLCPGGSSSGDTVNSCPPVAGRKLIVVFGDSHAEMWMPSFIEMATSDSWTLLLLAKSGCTPDMWSSTKVPRSVSPSWAECHKWLQWALGVAKGLKPTAAVITGAYTRGPGSNSFVAGIGALSAAAKKFAKAVIVIGDSPRMAKDPTDCLLHGGNTLKSCAATYPTALWATDTQIAAKAKAVHAAFLSTRGWFCYQTTCPMVVGSTIVYRDTGHVTPEYAQSLDAPFRNALERLILNQLTS